MKKNDRRGLAETSSLDILGPLQDIIRQVREEKLTKEHLQAFAEHRNPFEKKEVGMVVLFRHDKTKDGWTLLEDVPFDGKQFNPEIVEFLKSGESSVNGEIMKQRAKELNAHLGQRHAEYLLEHQELIPKEWRDRYLVFPGTVWQVSHSDHLIPCLCWGVDRWFLNFDWLMYTWYSCACMVRSR